MSPFVSHETHNNIWGWINYRVFIFLMNYRFKAHCGTFEENRLQQKGVFRVRVMWLLLSTASGTSSAHKRPLALSLSQQQSCNQSASLFLLFSFRPSLFISLCAVQPVRSLACLIWVNDAKARPGLRLQQESRGNSCGQAEAAYLSSAIYLYFSLILSPRSSWHVCPQQSRLQHSLMTSPTWGNHLGSARKSWRNQERVEAWRAILK